MGVVVVSDTWTMWPRAPLLPPRRWRGMVVDAVGADRGVGTTADEESSFRVVPAEMEEGDRVVRLTVVCKALTPPAVHMCRDDPVTREPDGAEGGAGVGDEEAGGRGVDNRAVGSVREVAGHPIERWNVMNLRLMNVFSRRTLQGAGERSLNWLRTTLGWIFRMRKQWPISSSRFSKTSGTSSL